MAKRAVRIYGDPCLKEKAQPVDEINDEVRALARDMGETMYENIGIGLAAPQVGEGVRLFVIDIDWVEREGGERKGTRNLRVFINPEILDESVEDVVQTEGCLSLPEIEGDVYRPERVTMRWTDENGTQHEKEMDGLEARCVQHEFDHLNGTLFVDRMSFVKRQLLAGKLRALKRRVVTEMVG